MPAKENWRVGHTGIPP